MHNNQNKEENKTDSKGKPSLAPELAELDKKNKENQKKYEKTEEINKKVQLTNDQVTSWTTRITQKIDK